MDKWYAYIDNDYAEPNARLYCKLESIMNESNSNIKKIENKLEIILINNIDSSLPYKLFTHSSNFVVEFNINDYILSKYFKEIDGNIMIRTGKKLGAIDILNNYLCEGISREIINFKLNSGDDNINSFFDKYLSIRTTLLPVFYNLLLNSSVIQIENM